MSRLALKFKMLSFAIFFCQRDFQTPANGALPAYGIGLAGRGAVFPPLQFMSPKRGGGSASSPSAIAKR